MSCILGGCAGEGAGGFGVEATSFGVNDLKGMASAIGEWGEALMGVEGEARCGEGAAGVGADGFGAASCGRDLSAMV